jgi:hypothetical protein
LPTVGAASVDCIAGDAGALHAEPEFAGAFFQVASQFILLEMTSRRITPEDGVTRYAYDHTQGPSCAIAAGAATLYRNYSKISTAVGSASCSRALAWLQGGWSGICNRPRGHTVDTIWPQSQVT